MDAENNNLDIREIEMKADQGYIYHREGRYKEALECYRFVLESRYAPIAEGIDIALAEWMTDENCPYWLYLSSGEEFRTSLFNYVQHCIYTEKELNVKTLLLKCINFEEGCVRDLAKDILVETRKIPCSADLNAARLFLLDEATEISCDDLNYYVFGYDY